MGIWPCIIEGGSHRPAIVLLDPNQLLHPAGAIQFSGVVVETDSGPCLEIGGIDGCYSVAVPVVFGIVIVVVGDGHVTDHGDALVIKACGHPDACRV